MVSTFLLTHGTCSLVLTCLVALSLLQQAEASIGDGHGHGIGIDNSRVAPKCRPRRISTLTITSTRSESRVRTVTVSRTKTHTVTVTDMNTKMTTMTRTKAETKMETRTHVLAAKTSSEAHERPTPDVPEPELFSLKAATHTRSYTHKRAAGTRLRTKSNPDSTTSIEDIDKEKPTSTSSYEPTIHTSVVSDISPPLAPVPLPQPAPAPQHLVTSHNDKSFTSCEISVYSYTRASECSDTYNTVGACGLSTYFKDKMNSTLPRLAVPMAVFDQFGSSQHNTLCGSKFRSSLTATSGLIRPSDDPSSVLFLSCAKQ